MHLRSVELKRAGQRDDVFPFSVPAIATLERLDMAAPVVFFVGENGSGKSTLLEGIAAAVGLPAIGSDTVQDDQTLAQQRALGRCLKLTWRRRVTRGFFLRAEDFFGFTKRMAQLRAELSARVSAVEEEFRDASEYAKGLAAGPARRSLADLHARYGADIDARSHGESFLDLFQARFVPGGLYLVDEPEAALSPQSQLALLVMLSEMTGQQSQFIIATHSPLLLACRGARLYSFDSAPISEVAYDDLAHVALTRAFLADPERYMRRLLGSGDDE